ncbi:hypothetical protein EST38_g5377 [Candolleomyces aberdarensis]|uniref:Uncharacterized protein n=1 Tax=Candolleomyces aberdarensis TaxID=2316362 RepID=A0A4Q2DNT5_9AGAR|nr:hypothetical protein EST38_g5377 [Candolleomyces aberdarensis]
MWQIPVARALAIEALSSLSLPPLDKIKLEFTYLVASWLIEGCVSLIENPSYATLETQAVHLGWKTAARIAYAGQQAYRLPSDGKVTISCDKFQCSECGATGLGLAEAVCWDNGFGPARTVEQVDCYTCDHAGRTVDVEITDLTTGASNEDVRRVLGMKAVWDAVKDVFADELKGMDWITS